MSEISDIWSDMPTDDVFLALSHPVRRRLLELLSEGSVTAGDLASCFDLSRPAVTEHLQVLRRAGLVRDEPAGRHRHYHLVAEPLADVEQWLHPFERFWRGRLRTLATLLEEDPVPDTDTAKIAVDQFIAAPPDKVWRSLTEPELLARWWAAGDIAPVVGHRFHLDMREWGSIPCEVTVADPPSRFVYTFKDTWTIDWRLAPEGTGTRLFLEHSGFDLDDPQDRFALENMGPGWRDLVVPRLAELAPTF